MRYIKWFWLFALLATAGLFGLQAQTTDYRQGVLYLAEGNFSNAPGEMHFVSSSGTVSTNVLATVNGTSPLGTTAQYAVQQGNHWYVTSKDYRQVNLGSQLVKLNAQTLVKEAALPNVFNHLPPQAWMAGEQVYHFLPLDDSTGWLTTTYGIYEVNLRSLSVAVDASSCAIPLQIDGFPSPARVDKLIRWGNYIVAAVNVQDPDGQDWASGSGDMGLYCIDRAQMKVVRKIKGRYIMPVVTLGRQLWCAKETAYLTQIVDNGTGNLQEGQHVQVAHVPTYVSWGWNEGWLTASTREDVLYMVDFNGWSADTILRIDLSAAQPNANPIWTGNSIYGNCREDPSTGNIWFSTFSGVYGQGETANRIAPVPHGAQHAYPFNVTNSFPSLPLFPASVAATRGARLPEVPVELQNTQYTITINQPENGEIIVGRAWSEENFTSGQKVDSGTRVRVWARATKEGYLKKWIKVVMGDKEIQDTYGGIPYDKTILTGDLTVSAEFAKGCLITAEQPPIEQGGLSFYLMNLETHSAYNLPGNSVLVWPTVKPGYRLKTLTYNGNVIDNKAYEYTYKKVDQCAYTFIVPAEDVLLKAVFEEDKGTITITQPDNGLLTAECEGTPVVSGAKFDEGHKLVFKAKADDGYVVKGIKIGEDVYSSPYTYFTTKTDVTVSTIIGALPKKEEPVTPTPVESAFLAGLSAYPNPVTTTLTVDGLASAHTLALLSATGLVVRQYRLQGKAALRLDLSSLPAGLYLLVVSAPDGERTLRVVKQ